MEEKKYNVVFFGTPAFAVPSLGALIDHPRLEVCAVVTQPDQPVGRHHVLTPPPIKVYAEKHHIPVHQPEKIRTPEFEATIRQIASDVVVIVAYGKIIPDTLLQSVPRGWINVHASLLPKYRGASPIQAALLHGDTESGVTIMQVEPTLDTGPILGQSRVTISPRETFETLQDRLAVTGAKLLPDTLLGYLDNQIIPKPQNHAEATVCHTLRKDNGKIDWSRTAVDIDRHIRALTPWPGAWTTIQGQQLKIHIAEPDTTTTDTPPGTLAITDGALTVQTGSTLLRIQRLQMEGKRLMDMTDFANGFAVRLPTLLGK